jgi:hypothetical protein
VNLLFLGIPGKITGKRNRKLKPIHQLLQLISLELALCVRKDIKSVTANLGNSLHQVNVGT